MPSRPYSRNRREHLKNLRKSRKGQAVETNRRTLSAAAPRRGKPLVTLKGLLTSLALVAALAVLVLFMTSAWLQYRESALAQKASQEQAAQAVVPGQNLALPPVDPATVEVRVLNGCGEPGAGRDMTTRLRDLRFDVVSAANADNFDYENTLVVNHTERPEVGLAVANSLGCTHLTSQPDEMALVDVTVILGRDWSSYVTPPQPETPPPVTIKSIVARARSIIGLQ
ncbi:LytR C-terminal domain-containing protein [bacterium]|nr:LytR C-terminal domain-containing protein [bacterium]